MYSTIPIHWNIKSAPASPGRVVLGHLSKYLASWVRTNNIHSPKYSTPKFIECLEDVMEFIASELAEPVVTEFYGTNNKQGVNERVDPTLHKAPNLYLRQSY
jgi:hypothetical protein